MKAGYHGRLLFLDPWLVAVSKPSGELVHPGWGRGERTTMSRTRDALGAHVHPLHRLDRATSGVTLMARDPETARLASEAFMRGEMRKRYLVLVRGRTGEAGVIDHPVRRGERGKGERSECRVAAVTRYRRLATCERARCTLIEAEPLTGRLHQIRRHFKHLSHPVVGDVNYGDGRCNRTFRADWGLCRLALHASHLAFVHPVTGEPVSIVAELPADLAEPFAALGLLAAARAALPPKPVTST